MDRKKFESRINIVGDCWEWNGALGAGKPGFRYGQFRENGKTVSAHRASYELYKCQIPNGMHVLHKCDNTKCVNPDHLFVGTNNDNIADSIEKGRRAGLKRKSGPRGKYTFTPEQKARAIENHRKIKEPLRLQIVAMYEAGGMTQRQLAEKFSVGQPTIHRIIREYHSGLLRL